MNTTVNHRFSEEEEENLKNTLEEAFDQTLRFVYQTNRIWIKKNLKNIVTLVE